MIQIDAINEWLTEPQLLTEDQRTSVDSLLKKYPYFIAGQYLKAILDSKKDSDSQLRESSMYLYKGNWGLYENILNKAKTGNDLWQDEPAVDVVETEDVEVVAEADVPVASEHETVAPVQPEETANIIEERKSLVEEIPEIAEVTPAISEDLPVVEVEEDLQEVVLREHNLEQGVIEKDVVIKETVEDPNEEKGPLVFEPAFTTDYFGQQGIKVDDELPELPEQQDEPAEPTNNSLLVMMSYNEWLSFFQQKSEHDKQEEEGKKALKSMWQREKLAAALGEEEDEIPESVFEMAVNSLAKEEGLISEPLAEILIKQEKWDKAIEMFEKLKLRNPQKSSYFASRIIDIQKEKEI